ncbi:MAG: D-glycero-D-manno-heptose 1 7-bisphosphate phosphatase [Chitinophagaceae bacterium]|nr:MAG: D-glycero-D-manno-heptose 1 7-bisphosphate phosphatase [Chitinophagaceae bacterium]
MLQLQNLGSDWTLFLDRDGVLNEEKDNDYILNWNEFVFYDYVLNAMPLLNKCFNKIIVTHQKMVNAIAAAGGRIDQIYFCTDLADNSPNRKPQPGMAIQAQMDFPEINFKKSIMVGNRMSDMQFGRNAGMHTVFVATTHPEVAYPDPHIDLRFTNLGSFAEACSSTRK